MDRIKRSFLSAAIAGGLCGVFGGSVALAQAGVSASTPGNAQGVQKLDEDHWKFKHMHHAMQSLMEARKELDLADDIFKGHKQDAIDHVDAAIKAIKVGLKEQNDEAALPAQLPSAARLDDEKFPHIRHALERLKDAKTELESADKIFGGHRDEAISHTDKAIKQIEDGLHEAM
jgi:hypothetical protein